MQGMGLTVSLWDAARIQYHAGALAGIPDRWSRTTSQQLARGLNNHLRGYKPPEGEVRKRLMAKCRVSS